MKLVRCVCVCVCVCVSVLPTENTFLFQQLRLVWTQLRDQVSAQDELDMAKMRLRIRFPDEPVPQSNKKRNPLQQLSSNIGNTVETIHIIEKHQVCYDCFK